MGLTAGKEAVFREDSNGIDDQDDNFGEDFVSLSRLECSVHDAAKAAMSRHGSRHHTIKKLPQTEKKHFVFLDLLSVAILAWISRFF